MGGSGDPGDIGFETEGPPGPQGKQGPRGFPGPVGPSPPPSPELPCCKKKSPSGKKGPYMENSAIGNSGFYIMANHLHKNARVIIYAGKEWLNRKLPEVPGKMPDLVCCAGCACAGAKKK